MFARVSNIESFRQWRDSEETDVQPLIDWIQGSVESEPMRVGTAFHKCLELAKDGTYETLEANGYTFILPDAEISLPSIREMRLSKNYGGLTVSGQVDGLHGKRIEDHKTTGFFGLDRYLEGYQWRFYLDIFGADVFRWNIFEVSPVRGKEMTYEVKAPHILEQYRYKGLHDDCAELAEQYKQFAEKYLTQKETLCAA